MMILKKVWIFLKTYYAIPIILLVAILFFLFRQRDSAIKLLDIIFESRKKYEKEVEKISKQQKKESEHQVEKFLEEQRKLAEKREKEKKELEFKEGEELKKITEKSSEEQSKELAKKLGIKHIDSKDL